MWIPFRIFDVKINDANAENSFVWKWILEAIHYWNATDRCKGTRWWSPLITCVHCAIDQRFSIGTNRMHRRLRTHLSKNLYRTCTLRMGNYVSLQHCSILHTLKSRLKKSDFFLFSFNRTSANESLVISILIGNKILQSPFATRTVDRTHRQHTTKFSIETKESPSTVDWLPHRIYQR